MYRLLGPLASVILGSLAFFTQNSPSPLENVKVLRIPTDQYPILVDAIVDNLELYRWTHPVSRAQSFIDIQVPEDKHLPLVSAINHISLAYNASLTITTLHENLAESIREERAGMGRSFFSSFMGSLANEAYFKNYHTYADHLQFYNDLVAIKPGYAKIVQAGLSTQRRYIAGIKISSGNAPRPAIVLYGNVHAREWISGMTVEYLAYELITGYGADPQVTAWVDRFDFHIFPIVNPDGFVFSQISDNDEHRLWRKNRSPPPGHALNCYGTDINRNWNHASWGQTENRASSADPCADNYHGSAPGSEPETVALRDYITYVSRTGLKLFIDWHSYGQLFMFPYAYSGREDLLRPGDYNRFRDLAAGYVGAVNPVNGVNYRGGKASILTYPASGTAMDYVYDNVRSTEGGVAIPVSNAFTVELRGPLRDDGNKENKGFLLPAGQIRPTVEENWAGFKHLLERLG